jgi:vacuolar-type H+-ATPase subunit F/Vma7
MRLVVLGDRATATGFALAGVESVACRTRDEVIGAITDVIGRDARVGIVLVSSSAYRLAPDVVEPLRERVGGPIVSVLPDEWVMEDGQVR